MNAKPKIGLFPGTFDPITNGHLDVIRRGRVLFDQLVVAIGHNPAKSHLFSIKERLMMITQLTKDWSNVQVVTYEGLTVDFARQVGAIAMLRGLRNVSDLSVEFQLALTNRAIADIETVFIMTSESYAFTSSTLIKQIASGGEVDRLLPLLPPVVLQCLKDKKAKDGKNFAWLHRDVFKE